MGVLMQFWKRWMSRSKVEPTYPDFSGALAPEQPLFIIGDVHGRIDLLDQLLAKAPDDAQLILVGDLIDRGDESAQVLNRARDLCAEGAICLMGNHEKMMLDFIKHPIERGPRWLRYGGLQTLQSYGVPGARERAGEDELHFICDGLKTCLSDGMQDWIKTLPLHWHSGNVHVVHAAADPQVDLTKQSSRVLLWGTRAFDEQPRQDGQWVVHGHTIVDEAVCANGRVSIDTGAYATGVLTGAYIQADECTFISTASV